MKDLGLVRWQVEKGRKFRVRYIVDGKWKESIKEERQKRLTAAEDHWPQWPPQWPPEAEPTEIHQEPRSPLESSSC